MKNANVSNANSNAPREFATRSSRVLGAGQSLVLAALALGVALAGQDALQAQPPPGAQAAAAAARPEQFEGLWEYNSEESRNVATGRPERGPRGSVPPRSIAARPVVAPSTAEGADVSRQSPFAPSPFTLRENRDLTRDLLEIAETLEFDVTGGAVTITDDLERARTYPTDNSRHRYRLGASEFFARVRWEDGRLRRDIEGSFGFRMTETYFLSPDASRLFVIIRVGEPARNRPQAGVDRVYDRISPEDP